MITVTRRLGLVAVTIGALSSSAYSQQIPTIFLQIVEHNGLPPADTTSLDALPGDELVIDVLAKEWSPAGEKARSFEVNLDFDSLASGSAGTISPKKGDRPCFVTADCTDISGFATCVGGVCITSEPDMAGILVDRDRLEPVPWMFFGLNNIGGLSTLGELKFGFLVTSSSQSPAYVSPRYLGTFVLIVSDDASGRFDIELLAFPSSVVNDAVAASEPIAAITGGVCMIDADCAPEEVCFLRNIVATKVCVTARTEGVSIRVGCGNGVVDPGEECDGGGESATCDMDCTAAQCGDGTLNLTAGEACDGMNDAACPGLCLGDCSCDLFCGDGACDAGENSCNCPSDCGTPPLTETAGSTCNDGRDNDCDGLIDFDDPDCVDQPIPTVSTWGLLVMLLLLLTGIKVTFGRREAVRG